MKKGDGEGSNLSEIPTGSGGEGGRKVEREMTFYNLNMIIALGYRVRSIIATRFRQWALCV